MCIRDSYNYIEFEPVFILDLRNEFISTYVICSGSFSFFSFSVLSKYKDTNLFTSSVRKNYSATDLLICMTSVTSCSDMSFDCFIKFSCRALLNKCDRFISIIESCSVD